MRMILCLLLLAFLGVFGALYTAEPAWTLYVRVPEQLAHNQFHEAEQQCERVLRLRPSLFADPANNQIGVIHITAAQAALKQSNYSEAQHWLTTLVNREGGTGSEAQAGHLLKELPSLQYQQARALLLQKDYDAALTEYQKLERLFKDDPILEKARHEACLAEVELAKKLNDQGDPEAALNRLAVLATSQHLPPWMVTNALSSVPALSERVIRGWLNRGDLNAAFQFMANLDERFTDPEIRPRLKDVRARIDLELFQISLDDPSRQRKAASTPAAAAKVADTEKAVLSVKNESEYDVTLVYVGAERVELSVPAKASKQLTLTPGRYLSGTSWADKRIRPNREQVVFHPGEFNNHIISVAPPKEPTQGT